MATQARIKERAYSIYHDWFKAKGWSPFGWQVEAFNKYFDLKGGLLNAPTGSGKTLAMFLPAFCEQLAKANGTKVQGLKILWISPVRALTKDVARALQEACDVLAPEFQVVQRTGDTEVAEKQKQRKNQSPCLVTTPESLHLILCLKDSSKWLSGIEAVIIDEWHELMGSKRGVQTELVLSKIRALNPEVKVWGVSATIGNLEEANLVIQGNRNAPEYLALVKADIDKCIEVESILPDAADKFPWAGHLGTHLLPKVLPILAQSNTTLIFTNTRAQCEIWYQKILEADPSLAGAIALHHSSLSAETRAWVEGALHRGSLKAVVCTSSLDLGVDFKSVETIIQVGGPKGVARFLQRAGRSGHSPGMLSKIYFLPAHSLELLEAASLRDAIKHGEVEEKWPVMNALDVLVQYLVTLAVGDGFQPNELKKEVLSCYTYQYLSEEEWNEALRFVTYGGDSLQAYGEYAKVQIEEGLAKVKKRGIALRHRLSIGTITSSALVSLNFMTGGYIGSVEEYFISKLKPGDVFTFAGRTLEFVTMKDMKALVRVSKKQKNIQVPHWAGGRMPLSSQLSKLIRQKLTAASFGDVSSPELATIQPILEVQRQVSVVPKEEEFLVEQVATKEGFHLFFYTFEGRLVNEGLAALLAFRVSRTRPITFSLAMTDYGFELLSDQLITAEEIFEEDLLTENDLVVDLLQGVNGTEMAQRKFRDICRIAGLTFDGFPGAKLKTRQLQASSRIFFKVFTEYEPDHFLLKQAYNEVLQDQLEEARMRAALKRIKNQKIIIKKPDNPTPFCFPIMVERIRSKVTSETLEDRVQKMIKEMELV